jgi:hypothetical protein
MLYYMHEIKRAVTTGYWNLPLSFHSRPAVQNLMQAQERKHLPELPLLKLRHHLNRPIWHCWICSPMHLPQRGRQRAVLGRGAQHVAPDAPTAQCSRSVGGVQLGHIRVQQKCLVTRNRPRRRAVAVCSVPICCTRAAGRCLRIWMAIRIDVMSRLSPTRPIAAGWQGVALVQAGRHGTRTLGRVCSCRLVAACPTERRCCRCSHPGDCSRGTTTTTRLTRLTRPASRQAFTPSAVSLPASAATVVLGAQPAA